MNKPRISEADFQATVIQVATLANWLVFHARPARYSNGNYATHYTGDAGFPDLVLCSPGGRGYIVAELKSDTGRLSAAQRLWLDACHRNGVEAYVWRPADIDYISDRLTRRHDYNET